MSNTINDEVWDAVFDKASDEKGPSYDEIIAMDLEEAFEYLMTGKYGVEE